MLMMEVPDKAGEKDYKEWHRRFKVRVILSTLNAKLIYIEYAKFASSHTLFWYGRASHDFCQSLGLLKSAANRSKASINYDL